MFAHIVGGQVRYEGPMPGSARRLDTGNWVTPPGGVWPPDLAAACGWLPVTTAARPADTGTHTHDRTLALVDGAPTVVWVQREWTEEEAQARAEAHPDPPPGSALPQFAINVTNPGRGLTPWRAEYAVDNADSIRETFTWINRRANELADNTTFTLIIPQGTYRHSGNDLRDLVWPGGFARINIVGTPGLRRSTLWCTRSWVPNLALQSAWGLNVDDVAFYGGQHGLALYNCQYVRLAGCTFEQQRATAGACLYALAGQNIFADRCNFLQSHSAFAWLTSSATVQVRNSLIGEAIQGAYINSGHLLVQDSTWFGVGSEHTGDGAAIYLGPGGNVTLQGNSIRLAPDVTRLIGTNYPGTISLHDNSVSHGAPLTLVDCSGLATYGYRPMSIQGNSFTGAHGLTLAAFGSDADAPRSSIILGNRFSFTHGTEGTLVVPEQMTDPARNNVLGPNVVRATTASA